MIHKILNIQNCGKFINYTPSEGKFGWNGVFEKINTVYAENGSGKTTFTQILKSLSGKHCDFVEKRKSLNAKGDLRIILMSNKKQYNYVNNDWNIYISNIEVYDSYYAEDHVYKISLGSIHEPSYFYDIVPNGYNVLKNLNKALRRRKNLGSYIRSIQNYIKKQDGDLDKLKSKKNHYENLRLNQNQKIKDIENQISDMIKTCLIEYTDAVNKYLYQFSPDIKITKMNQYGRDIVYFININGQEVRSDSVNVPLSHSLSEGDKSAISLSFFLARLKLLKNIKDMIIVFDDPISSFDTRRRRITVSILSKFAQQCKQFFLLSHDLNFVKDFNDKNTNALNLEIKRYQGSSVFVKQDIKLETMTGVTKDIYTLYDYLENGALLDGEKRDVIRCIRPVIEGIFRVKYFLLLNDKEWLGDFLAKIRDCDESSPLYRLKEYQEELSEINDYCKQYHHSNPKYLECPIYDNELKNYVERTLNIIQYI